MILKEDDFDYLSYIEYGNSIDLIDLKIAKIESINKLREYYKRKNILNSISRLGFVKKLKNENEFAFKFWATNVCYQIFRKLSEELPGFINFLEDAQCKPDNKYVNALIELLNLKNVETFIKEIIEYNGKLLIVYSDNAICSQDDLFHDGSVYIWGDEYFKVLNKVFQSLSVDQRFNMGNKSLDNPKGAKIYLNFENGLFPRNDEEYFTILIVSDKLAIKMVQANLLGYIREIKDFPCLSKSKERKKEEDLKRQRIKEKYKFNK